MFLLEAPSMDRAAPQRRTVYRISLTLVKRENLEEKQRGGGLLEQLQEVEDEAEGLSSGGCRRNFRTFSTGQLELGRMKLCRRLQPAKDQNPAGGAGGKKNKLLKARSVEESGSEPPPGPDGASSGEAPALSPALRSGLLRRSCSFRNWTGSELRRLKAKDKLHSSSGCIHQTDADPSREKSRTLEVGAILNRTDSMSDLSRWDRARAKNRTLDNSDLQRLQKEAGGGGGGGGGLLLRAAAGRCSERRLVRFFSGFFSRRDAATPTGSPDTGRGRRRRPVLAQSSTESVNGSDDAFVNSQEWTLSRTVPELKVGIVGNLASGKSALVHRYLTGTYVQEESPEGRNPVLFPKSSWISFFSVFPPKSSRSNKIDDKRRADKTTDNKKTRRYRLKRRLAE
ncbi:uncharacterized protein LOC103368790 [Stegastes partitus]|uniref:Uncharacterized protein LOC103368790 n=1 Tax=Stegastes partitus TaxID=144197 RepID=A0A9Y4TUX8_9TELE|nr:PREDICTED: uncharacterized protein LOC103368790 [Stegastes partitus]